LIVPYCRSRLTKVQLATCHCILSKQPGRLNPFGVKGNRVPEIWTP